MKLRSVTLSDVRRFSRPVALRGFGPGLNVLAAPNEEGKSTLFDALQALFFVPHRSRAKEVTALRPHTGGAPTVSAEIEDGGTVYRITKRWFSRPLAEVHQGTTLIAKGEAAEDWISALTEAPENGGPAGLLWVRQGLVALDQGERREQDNAHRARRDLLASVAGEVEALTGGRRMDRALAQTEAALSELITASGKSKAGGPLKAAEDELASLSERQADLSQTAQKLEQAIDARRRLRAELTELRDPEAQTARETRLAEARAAAETARAHADRLQRAADLVAARQAQRDSAAEKVAALARAREAVAAAAAKLAPLRQDEATQSKAAQQAQAALTAARSTRDAARAALQAAQKDQAAAQRAAQLTRDKAERDALQRRLAQARDLAKAEQAALRGAQQGPDEATLEALEAAASELRVQRELHARSAPRLRLDYLPGAPQARLDGAPLVDGAEHPLNAAAVLDLPGLGTLHLSPGAASEDDALAQAGAAYDAALAATGCASVASARDAARSRRAAEAALQEARAALRGVAPDGLRALETALAALPDADPEAAPPAAPDPETASEALRRAEAALAEADSAHDSARSRDEQCRMAEVRAMAARESAETRLDDLRAALPDDPEAAALPLAEALQEAEAALISAREAAAELAGDAPDLPSAEAALTRAQAVLDQAASRQRDLSERQAALDTEISLRAGEGVEEELAATEEQLARARDRAERYGFERDTLLTLKEALEAARSEAREHYFEPVTRELAPLLRLLWPEAELVFDEDSALPRALARDGREEPMEVLSGGTREQIALLVRLAFARLLSRGDRHAPVILDDALVYTDDARIERMFDALHRQAGDLQILVLTCRQRAFRDLGGQMLSFETAELPEEAR